MASYQLSVIICNVIGWSRYVSVPNLDSIQPCSGYSEYKTKEYLNFDLFLHSQHFLIATSSYYIIWLGNHVTYAYNIWDRFSEWFLRYKTRGYFNFDLHLHGQDGLISIWFFNIMWLADYVTDAYKIQAQFNQSFLRYKIKGYLNFDLHLHSQVGVIPTWGNYVILLVDHDTYPYQNLDSILRVVSQIQNKGIFELWPSFA